MYVKGKIAAALEGRVGAKEPTRQEIADEEATRWQKRFEWLHQKYGVDGGGCDSGDPLDFTETEVQLVIVQFENQITDLTRQHAEDVEAAARMKRMHSEDTFRITELENTNAFLMSKIHGLPLPSQDPSYKDRLEAMVRAVVCSEGDENRSVEIVIKIAQNLLIGVDRVTEEKR
jgi:hypothetical protein